MKPKSMYFSEAKRETIEINVAHTGKGKEVELMERKTLLEVGVGRGGRVHYLLLLPGLVPVRPIRQRQAQARAGGFRQPDPPNGVEVHALEQKELSGAPSEVGMVKIGRCGGVGVGV